VSTSRLWVGCGVKKHRGISLTNPRADCIHTDTIMLHIEDVRQAQHSTSKHHNLLAVPPYSRRDRVSARCFALSFRTHMQPP
jgi:hypothetical protein